jgi:uncharacterized protein YjcR
MDGLTLKQVAEKFGVAASTARLWQSQGYFPNAWLEETVIGPVWLVPIADLKAFNPPTMGRPAGKAAKKKRKGKARPKRKAPKRPKV